VSGTFFPLNNKNKTLSPTFTEFKILADLILNIKSARLQYSYETRTKNLEEGHFQSHEDLPGCPYHRAKTVRENNAPPYGVGKKS
jgi:hypothetical protein